MVRFWRTSQKKSQKKYIRRYYYLHILQVYLWNSKDFFSLTFYRNFLIMDIWFDTYLYMHL